jgi:hypothetical protein
MSVNASSSEVLLAKHQRGLSDAAGRAGRRWERRRVLGRKRERFLDRLP